MRPRPVHSWRRLTTSRWPRYITKVKLINIEPYFTRNRTCFEKYWLRSAALLSQFDLKRSVELASTAFCYINSAWKWNSFFNSRVGRWLITRWIFSLSFVAFDGGVTLSGNEALRVHRPAVGSPGRLITFPASRRGCALQVYGLRILRGTIQLLQSWPICKLRTILIST